MNEITVSQISPQTAWGLAKPDRVMRYDRMLGGVARPRLLDSFMLRDSRYAARTTDANGDVCYLAFGGLPETIVSVLDEEDHKEMLIERRKTENEAFASINGTVTNDRAIIQQAHQRWLAEEYTPDREPVTDTRKRVLRMIMASLKKDDRKLLRMAFGMHLTTEEMMEELGIPTKQAFTNRKTRLLDKIRSIYKELGFDVPTPEQLLQERQDSEHTHE